MGASEQQKVGKLFEAAGYEVTQAVGLAAGEVDWFATPRAGLSRPKTYFAAWERCPERLPEALAELERARDARRADKALGVVMEGRLPEGYKTDFGRGAEVVTYRRLALEVSGIAHRVRERVRAYEAEDGPSLYLSLRGKLESGESVDAAAYIKGWASEETTDSLVVVCPLRSSRLTPIRQAAYELGAQFELDPERVVPLVRYERNDALIPYEEGLAIPMLERSGSDLIGALRKLVLMHDVDYTLDPDDNMKGRHLSVMQPSSSELDGWFYDHLGAPLHARFMFAREAEPAFRALSVVWSNMQTFVAAMRAAPSGDRMNTAEWIVHVVSRYLNTMSPETLDSLDAMAFNQFAFGVSRTDTGEYFENTPLPPPEWLDNYEAFFQGEDPVLNRLVRDYLVARRIARDVASGRVEILTRHQFPTEYVLLFLAVISPSAAERAAEMRTQIEAEVERRLQLTLAHLLKRSVGAIRMNLGAVREDLPPELDAKHRYELDRIDAELRFLSSLAERTRRWQNAPNGPEETIVLCEIVAITLAPLAQKHPGLRWDIDLGPDLRVRARPTVLREILHFLLENAFHAASVARSTEPWVRVAGQIEGDAVVIVISDSGPGIPVSDREHVFEPYFTTKKGGAEPLGTGLGLTMARDYAKAIGAEVGLDPSRPETSFFIRLAAWKDAS